MASAWKEKTRKEIARELRVRDRQKLRELRHRIGALRVRRREALTLIRGECRSERDRVRAAVKALRAETLLALRERAIEMRAAQKGTCNVRRGKAREALAAELESAAQELRSERVTQKIVREADQRNRKKGGRIRAAERRSESDDEVRQNLSPEMVAVFNQVRSTIKGSPRKSRTEAFLQWVEENPGEVWTMRDAESERELRRLVAEEAEHRRAMKKVRRYRRPAELAAALSAVPF